MKAREIIAKWIWGYADREGRVDNILSDLTAAGYRLLAPGELDVETVERCVQVAEQKREEWRKKDKHAGISAGFVALAIRSLTPGSMEGRK